MSKKGGKQTSNWVKQEEGIAATSAEENEGTWVKVGGWKVSEDVRWTENFAQPPTIKLTQARGGKTTAAEKVGRPLDSLR